MSKAIRRETKLGYPIPESFEQIVAKKLDTLNATVTRELQALTVVTIDRLNELDSRLKEVEAVANVSRLVGLDSLSSRISKVEETLHPTKVFRDDLPGSLNGAV